MFNNKFLSAFVALLCVAVVVNAQGRRMRKMPPAGQPIMNTIGYLMHDGGHGTVPSDYDQYRKFIAMHLQK